MKILREVLMILICSVPSLPWATHARAAEPGFEAELTAMQEAWATAEYLTPEATRKRALEEFSARASRFSTAHPQRPEALIWEGIALSSYAEVKGALGGLGLAKKARVVLEQALTLDADALDGAAYTTLGALYFKVPGFPIGFGNHKTARKHLLKALEINPSSIDANFFFAEFHIEEKQLDDARRYVEKGLAVPTRPGREVADEGRRNKLRTLLASLQNKQ